MERLPGHPVRRRRPRAGGRTSRGAQLSARRVVLLRHGRTAHNATGRIQGQLDVALDEVGLAQAAAVAPVLSTASPYTVLTSDLSRAALTAAPLVELLGLTAVADVRLREVALGTWEGLSGDEVRARFPDEHAAWRAGDDVRRGGGETYAEAGERAVACISEHLVDAPDGGTLIAVTHGATARATLGLLLGLPVALWGRLAPLGNTCWSVLVEDARGWRLERHNTGLGPLVGPATGAHDLGTQPVGGTTASADDDRR